MIFEWLAGVAVSVFSWLGDRMGSVDFSFPAPWSLEIPIPGGLNVSSLDTWLAVTLSVAGVLILGRVAYWIYRILPFNG